MRTHTIPHLLIILIILSAILSLSGCGTDRRDTRRMDLAETLMDERPDSSLLILDSIDTLSLKGDHAKARYALLRSIALDKNCIDTADFSVIQPAVDYYLRHGSPREKLRTYYYQGRIYQNADKFNSAMWSFDNALSIGLEAGDTMTTALAYLAKSVVYFQYYDIHNCLDHILKASRLYHDAGDTVRELGCIRKGLDGALLTLDRHLADSLFARSRMLTEENHQLEMKLYPEYLNYAVLFLDDDQIRDEVRKCEEVESPGELLKFELFGAYCHLKDQNKAQAMLMSIKPPLTTDDSLKYYLNEIDLLKLDGNYRMAYNKLDTVSDILGMLHVDRFGKDLQFEREGFLRDSEISSKIRNREDLLIVCVSIIVILFLLVIVFYMNRKVLKIKQKMTVKEKVELELNHQILLQQNLSLNLEKINAELETERQKIREENLRLQINGLEHECEDLKKIINHNRNLNPEASKALNERISQINHLLASHITGDDRYVKDAEKWISKIMKDRSSFIRSNRLAFEASHPNFMKYLKERNLSERELEFICLYAIGLSGKEIGVFIDLKRHYSIGADIRKKLNLADSTTNLRRAINSLLEKG